MPKSSSKTLASDRRRLREGGFTLVEVVLALMVLAVAVTVLLERRVGIIRETAEARDARRVWIVMAHKMAELELDPTIWQGDGRSDSGDFSDLGSEYVGFYWDYEIIKVEIPTHDPDELEEEPSEAYQITLQTHTESRQEPFVLQALYPLPPPEPATPAAGESPSASEQPGNSGGGVGAPNRGGARPPRGRPGGNPRPRRPR